MGYSDFTMESVEKVFGLTTHFTHLFPDLVPLVVPDWVAQTLDRGRETMAMLTEKARSEMLVVPILQACREFAPENFSIYSGQRLDVDPTRGLSGECDYLLALTPLAPRFKAPLVAVLEAKKGDIEAGLGQCVAQLIAARIFNDRAGEANRPLFGCVTTGEDWQFLRLHENEVIVDRTRRYIADIGSILAALRECLIAGKSVSARMAD